MPPDVHTFLFSPSHEISPLSSRRVHLRRLYDVLHLSIQRGDLHRARRAWAILVRCKEIDWRTSWMLATGLLGCSGRRTESTQTKIDYLRTMMLHLPDNRESILCELVHLYVVAGRHREALDELEFSLTSFPYRDNATLNIYAGICSVLASQPDPAEVHVQSIDVRMLDRAQVFFERSKLLDPKNIIVDLLLEMTQNPIALLQTEASSEIDSRVESDRVKRLRTWTPPKPMPQTSIKY